MSNVTTLSRRKSADSVNITHQLMSIWDSAWEKISHTLTSWLKHVLISSGRNVADNKGLLFDIQGFSVHDGPGCRTVVFLKGCPLRCRWCCNPEGFESSVQVMYYQDRCTMDYSCKSACKHQAIRVKRAGEPIAIDRTKCSQCIDLQCTNVCDYNALSVSGYYITVDKLMEKIQKDRHYWGLRGGVTLSGGEPMLQPEFTRAVLQHCYDSYIHTAMETSGYAQWKYYENVVDYLDWIFFDLKHMESKMHVDGTGFSNSLILRNARKIALLADCRLVFRMPVIPGFNNSLENLIATAEFIHGVDKNEINILPLHHLGSSKYDLLGLKYYYKDRLIVPDSVQLDEIRDVFADYSIECYIGSDTPF